MRFPLPSFAIVILLAFGYAACEQDGSSAPPQPKPDAVSSPVQVLGEAADRIRDVAKTLGGNPTPAVVPVEKPVEWIPLGPDGKRLQAPSLVAAADMADGTYMLTGVPGDGQAFQYKKISITTLTGPQPPPAPPVVVVPPGPKPPVPPDVPVTTGSKRIVVIRESLEPSPEMGRLIVLMQSGPIGQYMKSKGHEFESFDQNAKDEHGNPSAYVKQWLDAIGDTKIPAAVIVNIATGTIDDVKHLGETPTAQALLDFAKEHGG
jgi:hypothetical protein